MYSKKNVIMANAMRVVLLVFVLSGIGNADPIEGGTRVTSDKSYPFMAALRYKDDSPPFSHFCGASIIHPRYVLSAAHCIRPEKPKDVIVVVGAVDRREVDDARKYGVEDWIWHTGYDKDKKDSVNDIALIRVDRDFDFSTPSVQPIALDTTNFGNINTQVVLIGFGQKGAMCDKPNIELNELQSTIVDIKFYKDMFETYNPKSDLIICTYCMKKNNFEGDDSKRFTSCLGDSGGPVAAVDPKTGNWALVGVISTGDQYFVNAVKVYTQLNWISETKIKISLAKLDKPWWKKLNNILS